MKLSPSANLLPPYLHTNIFKVKVDYSVLYAVETQIEHLAIEL
jgi:hypothetical protein